MSVELVNLVAKLKDLKALWNKRRDVLANMPEGLNEELICRCESMASAQDQCADELDRVINEFE